MQAFSNILSELYDLATSTPPENFAIEMLRTLRSLISFDGAVIRIGGAETAIEYDSITMQEAVYKRDWSYLQDNSKTSDYERIIATALNGLSRPLTGTCHEVYKDLGKDLGLASLYNFSQKLAFHHLLLFGEPPGTDTPARWLVLYRDQERDLFNEREAGILHALWKHLLRTFTINLKNALKQIDDEKRQHGFALVNSLGAVEVADSSFSTLLSLEWPDTQVDSALDRIMQRLQKTTVYRGKRIRIALYPKFGYLVCAVTRLPSLELLSPSEQTVAERFASGNNYKKIALQLDMAPSTVRNHIANVYRKLGIHDKALLASLIAPSNRQAPRID